jgi:hypothetical protein
MFSDVRLYFLHNSAEAGTAAGMIRNSIAQGTFGIHINILGRMGLPANK